VPKDINSFLSDLKDGKIGLKEYKDMRRWKIELVDVNLKRLIRPIYIIENYDKFEVLSSCNCYS